jgi:small subunit ribosomal protein S2
MQNDNSNSNSTSIQDLLEAGVHFGHLRSKWDPQMSPYIFMEKNGIHLIDLNKTAAKLEEAAAAMKNIARSGRKILFVATKKQAKEIVSECAKSVGMPFVTDRWLGGMLTNFATVRKSIKKMTTIDKMNQDGTVNNMAKRERLMLSREREKLERMLGGINDLTRLPAALFIVDIKKEHIAVAEAHKLGLTSFGIVDTNANPNEVDFAIPGNDDATKSIALITGVITKAIEEGLSERKQRSKDDESVSTEQETTESQN